MATFKPFIRYKRSDGLYQVYIRVVHRTQTSYIKTNKLVSDKQISKNKEIKDPIVLKYCLEEIVRYTELINRHDISKFTVQELVEFLMQSDDDVCFSDYARNHIKSIINEGKESTAKSYSLALASLEKFRGSTQIMFSSLTSNVLNRWLKSLSNTNRAKEMYPTCIRQIFKSALVELNDDERGIIRIKFNPWLKVSIPKSDKGRQRAISAEACREFFNRPLPETKMRSPLAEFARDVCLLSLCLGGINTVDLYSLKKSDYRNGIICYQRAKTKGSRSDGAYMEMRVEPFIKSTFDKYLSKDPNDEFLFMFHNRHSNSDSFNANVNIGIRRICADMGMKKEDRYCYYTFRHTWATIAQNDCDANLYDVAFGLNHSHGMNVTRGYVKIDFTPAWELNAKVIDFIFFSDATSKQGNARDTDEPADKYFRISKKMMIYGRAYFKGVVVAETTDVGFNNVDEVLRALYPKLPADIPVGSTLQFRLVNCDSKTEAIYERCKGKSF